MLTCVVAGAGGEDSDLCSVNDLRLSRLFAELLLRSAAKYNLQEFLTIWPQSVPPGECRTGVLYHLTPECAFR